MAIRNANREELQIVINQLDQALHNHLQWYKDLLRTLVCRLPADQHDTAPDAHKQCRFGQWYSNYRDKNILDHPGFAAIGEAHQRMHEVTAQLLIAANTGGSVLPHNYDNFANALERLQLEIFTMRRELEELLYNRDPLTGAINRIDMLPWLREQQELVKRQVIKSFCIAMMDLDLFKAINDRFGHVAGDKVLVAATHYIIDHFRAYDKIFRYGGEEFLLCLQDVTLDTAYEIVEQLRKGLSEYAIDIGAKEPLHITASFGLALLDPDIPVEQSIDRADKAVYAAKNAGRNCTKNWGLENNAS